ncbi:hypothetical protein F5Y06DRAFT_301629 [Hypoxylon sp. FL0890]|nr:hypothetical protein F5Y06DRAFT_301629 [Hypoxylon sp. FL0890]
MLPTSKISGVNSDNSRNIFEDAQMEPSEFYASTFKLKGLRLEQNKIEGTGPDLDFSEQAQPYPIMLIMEGGDKDWKKKLLGRNLLDSFALIFSQPGSHGVIATVLGRSSERTNGYTLWVAANSVRRDPPNGLLRNIEHWFTTRKSHEGYVGGCHVDKPDLQNSLWTAILRNCHSQMCMLLRNMCDRKQKQSKNTGNAQEWIKTIGDFAPYPYRRYWQDIQPGLLSVLQKLEEYSSDNLGPLAEKSTESWKKGNATDGIPPGIKAETTSKLEEFLNTVTTRCYDLLKSHEKSMEYFLEHCGETRAQDEMWLRQLRRFIYMMANYRRAWYDMVRFKTDHDSATLWIKCIPNSEYLKGNSIMLTPIFNAGVNMGIYDRAYERKFKREYANLSRKVLPHVHCEMRILDFVLGSRHLQNFFGYIGCSKGPCWLCYHTLKYMAPDFGMRAPHWKLYPVWEPPRFQESPQNREGFIKVLQFLDKTVKDRLDSAMNGQVKIGQYRYSGCGPDCPDVENTFLSPRKSSMPWLREIENNSG